MWAYISHSTLKREAASILMLWLMVAATYLMIVAPTWDQKLQVMNVFALPFMGLFLGAFGADYVAKQTNIAGPPSGQPATETSAGNPSP